MALTLPVASSDEEATGTEPRGPVAPARAEGIELLGPQLGSGHRRPPGLVRRADGQAIQLTPLLYGVLEKIDGNRDHGAIAGAVSRRIGKEATEDDIRFLIDERLRPLGVVDDASRKQAALPRANPLLAVRLRRAAISPERTRRLTASVLWLFRPFVVLVMLAAFSAASVWVLFEKGLGGALHQAIYEPELLLLVVGLTILSAGFHELGHAAACHYGGAKPGAIGAGVYLVWPAFYTDVTDSYRLDRRGRLRVDVGGIYFNAVFGVAAMGVWSISGIDALLLVVPLQLMQMLRQLPPFVRLDGYHILADLTGVPDLYLQMRPLLTGLLPTRWGRAESRRLRPWVRVVVTTWILVVVPVLATAFVSLVLVFPRLAATAWDSLRLKWTAAAAAVGSADIATAALAGVSMVAVALPVASTAYLLSRVARRTLRSTWRATAGRPVLRSAAILAGAGMLAVTGSAWWPDGQYRPVTGDDRVTVGDVLETDSLLRAVPVAATRLAGEVIGEGPAAEATARQSDTAPRAAVGAPGGAAAAAPPSSAVATPPTSYESWRPPWAVRFNPPQPGDGDNYAVALNTTDGTSVVAFALSLIMADGERVENGNRAYALTNCAVCTAIAVAFQVVLILTPPEVVIPVNLAVSLTASCVTCLSLALAVQLIVSIDGPLSDGAAAAIDAVFDRLRALEDGLGPASASRVAQELRVAEAAILDILVADGAMPATDPGGSSGSSGTATPPALPPPDSAEPTAPAEPAAPPPEATTTTEPSPTPTPPPPPDTTTTTPPPETTVPNDETTTTTVPPP